MVSPICTTIFKKAAPLHVLKKKGAIQAWTESCQEAFETIKNDLTQTPVLISPDFSRPFKVQTDGSHPQTNLTEHINHMLKTMIASYVNEHHRHWDCWLAEFRFAINTAWQESTRFTPAEIALGRKLKGPVERALSSPPDPSNLAYSVLERYENLLKSVRENVEQAQRKQGRYYSLRRKHAQYQVGELVWVRSHPLSRASEDFMSKLAAKWKGPAKILKCLGPVNCSLAFLDDPDHPDTFHVQNLKLFHGYVRPSNEGKGM